MKKVPAVAYHWKGTVSAVRRVQLEKGDYEENKYIVSFVGFAPIDDPEVGILIILDEAKSGSSAPAQKVAARVLEKILPYLNIYPGIISLSGNPYTYRDTPCGEDCYGKDSGTLQTAADGCSVCLYAADSRFDSEVGYIQLFRGEYLSRLAEDLHYRERILYARRGEILDRNGVVLASSASVCSVSVIHNQIEDTEAVARLLSEKLGLDHEDALKKVEKKVALQIIKTRVEPETCGGDPGCGTRGNSDRREFQKILSVWASGVPVHWLCGQ